MPRRTNPFQRIIYLIEQQLAPAGALVQQSVELPNRAGSGVTEVDILVTLRGVGRPFQVAIECQNERRRATVEWMRELWGKYKLLDVDRVVAVAGRGFGQNARREAKFFGINALTLDEAHSFDWAARLRTLAKLVIVDVLYEHIGTSVEISGNEQLPNGFASDSRQILIALPPKPDRAFMGEKVFTLWQFIDRMLSEPALDDLLALSTEKHPNKEGWLGATLPRGAGIFDVQGRRFDLLELRLRMRRVRTAVEVPMSHAAYDGAAIAVGSAGEKGSVNVAFVQLEGAEIAGKARMLVDGQERVFDLPDMAPGP